MGQAKRRGTFEERRSKAIALGEALLERRNLELTTPTPKQVAMVGTGGMRRATRLSSMLPLLALAALTNNERKL